MPEASLERHMWPKQTGVNSAQVVNQARCSTVLYNEVAWEFCSRVSLCFQTDSGTGQTAWSRTQPAVHNLVDAAYSTPSYATLHHQPTAGDNLLQTTDSSSSSAYEATTRQLLAVVVHLPDRHGGGPEAVAARIPVGAGSWSSRTATCLMCSGAQLTWAFSASISGALTIMSAKPALGWAR